jgi:PleD family two-component response regulator
MLAQRTTASPERWNNSLDNRRPIQFAASPRPCRVLVVDDDDVVRTCLSALLKRARYDVEVAASGEEALRVMGASRCDIVLTDWQMPNMDGISLCRHVRLEYQEDNVYVLLLTVRDTQEDRLAGIAAGADDYIIKGGPINDLLERLNTARCITQTKLRLRNGNREHRRFSITDPLTKARNLRFFNQQLPRAIARAQRNRHALSVLSCRIDEFEPANHRFGDDVGAARVARQLRQIFAAIPVSTPLGPIGFTVSIAVTSCEPKHSINSLPRMWDLLLSPDGGALH